MLAKLIEDIVSRSKNIQEAAKELLEAGIKARNPFKNSPTGILGPGSVNYIHASAVQPWDCNVVEPYTYHCTKRDPATGQVLKEKTLYFDPEKVKARNERYRPWHRGLRQAKRAGKEDQYREKPNLFKHPTVKFTSHLQSPAVRERMARATGLKPEDLI